MTYFVTGATGFIGRNLVERLLEARGRRSHVARPRGLARAPGGADRELGRRDRVQPVVGDLGAAELGVDEDWIAEHEGTIDHFFHLAAVYDMAADERGTTRSTSAARATRSSSPTSSRPALLHHVSSIAVAGALQGPLPRGHVRRGPEAALRLPPHEVRVREHRPRASQVPWRVYRPAIVVGNSQTGEMDKIDGPYYFFKVDPEVCALVPEWVPLVGPEIGETNIVPVDYVPRRSTRSPTSPTSTARHSTSPTRAASLRRRDQHVRARRATRRSSRCALDKRLTDALPKGVLSLLMQLPGAQGRAQVAPRRLRDPRGGRRAHRR